MTDLYELRLKMSTDNYTLYCEHRLPQWPEVETVKELLEEVLDWFDYLFDTEPTDHAVSLARLDVSEDEPARMKGTVNE